MSASDKPWKYLSEGSRAIATAMRILYAAPVFMPNRSAVEVSDAGYRFLLCYANLVQWAMLHRRLVFNLVPKLHYLHHVLADLRDAGLKNARVFNPMCNCTSQCEDFIGHIARLSRRVSPKHPHSRVLRRYQAALADKMGLLK